MDWIVLNRVIHWIDTHLFEGYEKKKKSAKQRSLSLVLYITTYTDRNVDEMKKKIEGLQINHMICALV